MSGFKQYSYDPTPEEIERRTAQIRATWSPVEKEKRASKSRKPFKVKRASMSLIDPYITPELWREAEGWEYITDKEYVKEQRQIVEEDLEDEPVEVEAEVVEFGETIS